MVLTDVFKKLGMVALCNRESEKEGSCELQSSLGYKVSATLSQTWKEN